MDGVKRDIIKKDDFKKLAPEFGAFFLSLTNIIQTDEEKRRVNAAKKAKQQAKQQPPSDSVPFSTLPSSKRPAPNPVLVSGPFKRQKNPSPRPTPITPDQPTHPIDPDYSGSTAQSKNKDYTKHLLQIFMVSVLSVLESGFRTLRWPRGECPIELCIT
jgi:hypothetical protein